MQVRQTIAIAVISADCFHR